MNYTLQRLGAWSGIALIILLGIFFWAIAGLVPPLSPASNAEDLTRALVEHKVRLRIGIGLLILFSPIVFPFICTISIQLHRIEGQWGVLSLSQFGAGIVTPIGFMFPSMVFGAALFRPESRSPDVTQALNDVFWLMFIGVVGTLVVQCAAIAIGTLCDRSAEPVFPRWFGYFNIWCGVLFVPGSTVLLFHTGPLAWNGVFSFWIPLAVFASWMIVVALVLLTTISAEQVDAAPLHGASQ